MRGNVSGYGKGHRQHSLPGFSSQIHLNPHLRELTPPGSDIEIISGNFSSPAITVEFGKISTMPSGLRRTQEVKSNLHSTEIQIDIIPSFMLSFFSPAAHDSSPILVWGRFASSRQPPAGGVFFLTPTAQGAP
jgi:hypothetical protein